MHGYTDAQGRANGAPAEKAIGAELMHDGA